MNHLNALSNRVEYDGEAVKNCFPFEDEESA